jgi:hypothetical protein
LDLGVEGAVLRRGAVLALLLLLRGWVLRVALLLNVIVGGVHGRELKLKE